MKWTTQRFFLILLSSLLPKTEYDIFVSLIAAFIFASENISLAHLLMVPANALIHKRQLVPPFIYKYYLQMFYLSQSAIFCYGAAYFFFFSHIVWQSRLKRENWKVCHKFCVIYVYASGVAYAKLYMIRERVCNIIYFDSMCQLARRVWECTACKNKLPTRTINSVWHGAAGCRCSLLLLW